MLIRYDHNNSGGHDWMTPEQWEALRAAGWNVRDHMGDASKDFPTVIAAKAEWQRITGNDPNEEGCECCGNPHTFWTPDGQPH